MNDAQEKLKKLEKWFTEEIKRRDKIIDELRKENMILLKTSLKKAEDEISEIQRKSKK